MSDNEPKRAHVWRAKARSRKGLAAIGVLLLAVGIVAAATIFTSNRQSGTWTTSAGLTISGFSLPTVIDPLTETFASVAVANGLTRTMTGTVVTFELTKPGLAVGDVTVRMSNNGGAVWYDAITGSPEADTMTYSSTPFDIPAGTATTVSLSVWVNTPGAYAWSIVAVGSAG